VESFGVFHKVTPPKQDIYREYFQIIIIGGYQPKAGYLVISRSYSRVGSARLTNCFALSLVVLMEEPNEEE